MRSDTPDTVNFCLMWGPGGAHTTIIFEGMLQQQCKGRHLNRGSTSTLKAQTNALVNRDKRQLITLDCDLTIPANQLSINRVEPQLSSWRSLARGLKIQWLLINPQEEFIIISFQPISESKELYAKFISKWGSFIITGYLSVPQNSTLKTNLRQLFIFQTNPNVISIFSRQKHPWAQRGRDVYINPATNKSLPKDSGFSNKIHLQNSVHFTSNQFDILFIEPWRRQAMDLNPARRKRKANFFPRQLWVPHL